MASERMGCRVHSCRMLLELGANFRHCARDGETVMDKAVRSDNAALIVSSRLSVQACGRVCCSLHQLVYEFYGEMPKCRTWLGISREILTEKHVWSDVSRLG